MEQKTKFILVGLIGVSLIFGLLYLQSLGAKQGLINEKNDLQEHNASLNAKLSALENKMREEDSKITSLNKELEKAVKEKGEIEKKYQLVNKERDELIAKLKAQQERLAQMPQAQAAQKEEVKPEGTDDYWAGVLKEKTDLALQLNDIRSELKSIQIKNEELAREKSGLELDLKNTKNEKDDLARKFEYNRKLLDNISKELVAEKNYKMGIESSFKALKNEYTLLTRQIKGLDSSKIGLERKVQELKERNAALENRVSDFEVGLISRISQFKEQLESIQSSRVGIEKAETAVPKRESSVELPPIIVRPQTVPLTQHPIGDTMPAGSKVLSINKENNFVIIDKGAGGGVKVGQIFNVEREGKQIAELEVIQVRDNIAACDIKSAATPIKVGDAVR
jgi:predicted  nucleic acid-binding Zn-ribbon protein